MEKLRKHISHGTEGASSEPEFFKGQDRGRFHQQRPVSAVSRILALEAGPQSQLVKSYGSCRYEVQNETIGNQISQAKAQRQSPDSGRGNGQRAMAGGERNREPAELREGFGLGRLQGRVPHWTVRTCRFLHAKFRRPDGDRLTASYLTAPFPDPASTDICCATGNDDRRSRPPGLGSNTCLSCDLERIGERGRGGGAYLQGKGQDHIRVSTRRLPVVLGSLQGHHRRAAWAKERGVKYHCTAANGWAGHEPISDGESQMTCS